MVSSMSSVQIQTQTHFGYRFSRGWTLQELIAPGSSGTRFFDKKWNYVGSKYSLCSQLSLITGIDAGILSHVKLLSTVCVAHKMSWAANRETTRIEDMAYCLLGLFDVNMPLLYGEEFKAFRRLQEEIIRTTSDLSIFAWRDEPSLTERRLLPVDLSYHCGILARTPSPFGFATSILAERSRGFSREFSVCNQGVKTQSVMFGAKDPLRIVVTIFCRFICQELVFALAYGYERLGETPTFGTALLAYMNTSMRPSAMYIYLETATSLSTNLPQIPYLESHHISCRRGACGRTSF